MNYGTRSRHVNTVIIPGACGKCGAEGSVRLQLFRKYAHASILPLVPLGRTGYTECSNCKQVLEGKMMSPSAQQLFNDLKPTIRAKWWMYSGAVILAIAIPFSLWLDANRDQQTATFLAEPKAGDLYEVKLSSGNYSFYKVALVSGDSIYVGLYNYETTRMRGLSDLLKKEDGEFGEDLIGYSHADVLAMREDGMILAVRDR